MSFLTVNNLYKSFGKTDVLRGITFNLESNDRLALVGKSGSGKTTILRLIAGLEIPDSGTINIENELINSDNQFVKPEKRNIGYVFQNHSLFPHLNVLNNIIFGIKNQSKESKKQTAIEYLAMLGLEEKLKNYPHELSGGEKQRISIIRTLAYKPKLLLLDEPFSNLDKNTKEKLKLDLKKILDIENIPTILITHDAIDSFDLANKVILLDAGKVVTKGEPEALYQSPQNEHSAKYFSETNLIERNEENYAFFEKFGISANRITLLPSNIKIVASGIPAIVESSRFLGEGYYTYVNCLGAKMKIFSIEKQTNEIISIYLDVRDMKEIG